VLPSAEPTFYIILMLTIILIESTEIMESKLSFDLRENEVIDLQIKREIGNRCSVLLSFHRGDEVHLDVVKSKANGLIVGSEAMKEAKSEASKEAKSDALKEAKSNETKGGSEVLVAAEELKAAKATDSAASKKTKSDYASKEAESKETKDGNEVLVAAEELKATKPTEKAAARMPTQGGSVRYQRYHDDDMEVDNHFSQAEISRIDLLWDDDTKSPKETEPKKKKAKTEDWGGRKVNTNNRK
jgi:hypothetical protein